MILEVVVEGWKPFGWAEVELGDGMTFIHGPNGSGKSSLLDAIAYGLYGSDWLKLSEGRMKLEELQKWGESYTKVRLKVLGNDGRMYAVQRVIREGGGVRDETWVMDEGGTRLPESYGDRSATSIVEEIMGMPCRTFVELLYLKQGRLREIIEGARRRERLDSLFGIRDLEDAYKEARELERRIESRLSDIRTSRDGLKGRIAVFESRARELRNEMEELEIRISGIGGRVSEARRLFEGRRKEELRLEELVRESLKLKGEISILREQIDLKRMKLSDYEGKLSESASAAKELSNLKDIEHRRSSLEGMLHEIALRIDTLNLALSKEGALRSELEGKASEIRRLEELMKEEEDAREREKKLGEEIGKLDELKLAEEGLRKELESWMEREAYLRTMEELELAAISSLERSLSCPLCERDLSQSEAKYLSEKRRERCERIREELSEARTKVGMLREELERIAQSLISYVDLSRELSEAKSKLMEVAKARGEVESLRRRVKEIESEMRELDHLKEVREEAVRAKDRIESEIRELDFKLALMEELSRKAGMMEEYRLKVGELSSEISGLSAELESKSRRLEGLRGVEEEYHRVRVDAEAAERNYERILMELEMAKALMEDRRRELEKVMGELGRLREELGRISIEESKLSSSMELLKELRNAFREAQPLVRETFIDLLNVEAERVFLELRHKASFEGIEMTSDYEVYVREAGGRRIPVEQCSGGEKTLISLVLRYAVAKVLLGQVPLMLLDEPTEFLDSEHRERLVEWLQGMGEVRQMLVTSHIGDFEKAANHIIAITLDEGGMPRIG